MKKTNTYSYKLAIAATSAVMIYFTSAITSLAQAAELVKAEQIEAIQLHEQAKQDLQVSFSTLALEQEMNAIKIDSMLAEQKNVAKENQTVTITKLNQISE